MIVDNVRCGFSVWEDQPSCINLQQLPRAAQRRCDWSSREQTGSGTVTVKLQVPSEDSKAAIRKMFVFNLFQSSVAKERVAQWRAGMPREGFELLGTADMFDVTFRARRRVERVLLAAGVLRSHDA